MKNKLFQEILSNIQETKEDISNPYSKILVIDAFNTFLRSFAMINHINKNGHHIGGLTGFLKSIGYAIKQINPTKVVIVFDGAGSTVNKKNLYPDYKANRNIAKITNWEIFDDKEEEKASINNQMLRLIEYLKLLPVTLISIDRHEADDIIGYITTYYKDIPENHNITIMSADQDFLQLVSDKVKVYSPVKKKFYNKETVLEEYGITSTNFIYYKTLLGDSSDNLPGIKGLGPKKIIKFFPELTTEQKIQLNDIFVLSETKKPDHELYSSILTNQNQLKINYQLMNLHQHNMLDSDIEKINTLLEMDSNKLNSSKFLIMYEKDELNNSIPRVSEWLIEVFGFLNKF
jgi:5'-3' exonuclease